jgi:uncharacterized Fe-S cluster-containing MiaB family protein
MNETQIKISIKKRLRTIWRKVKQEAIKERKNSINFAEIASSSIREGYLNNQAVNRIIFYLRGYGCQWALSDGGVVICAATIQELPMGKNSLTNTSSFSFKKNS